MNVVLLRVGVDSGSGGIQGPLFDDGSFELIPIPDGSGVGLRTYGNTLGIKGLPYSTYFPASRWNTVERQAMHIDPEFASFTYGEPHAASTLMRCLPGLAGRQNDASSSADATTSFQCFTSGMMVR